MADVASPWEPPTGHLAVERRWKYAPPPWVMYEAIVHPNGGWMRLLSEEGPLVARCRRPDRVLFVAWPGPSITALEILIESSGEGSELTARAYTNRSELTEDERRVLRHRLGEVFGADLRRWVDQPHG